VWLKLARPTTYGTKRAVFQPGPDSIPIRPSGRVPRYKSETVWMRSISYEYRHQQESFETNILDAQLINFSYDGENLTFTIAMEPVTPRVFLYAGASRFHPTPRHIAVRTFEQDSERTYEIGMVENVFDLDECSQEAFQGAAAPLCRAGGITHQQHP